MKMNYTCLPCLVNQVIKVSDITNASDKETLFRHVFQYLGNMDFSKTTPEIIGGTFQLVKEHINNEDPYMEIRNYYNDLFLTVLDSFEEKINQSEDPFKEAIKYAIVGNIIDFNPIHNSNLDNIMQCFENIKNLELAIDHSDKLRSDLEIGRKVLYLGDNCGEICLDKLFIKKIKELYPYLDIYFAVRGKPVVNDSIETDAYHVGMHEYATIISNGDDSLGTVLPRTSAEFRQIYHEVDVVIAKGQANYECLSEQTEKNIYFLLMTKCEVIAMDIGVDQKALVCMNSI